jgi:hypothetical protein
MTHHLAKDAVPRLTAESDCRTEEFWQATTVIVHLHVLGCAWRVEVPGWHVNRVPNRHEWC